MENPTQLQLPKTCANCGAIYNIKTEMPELCWACGMPTEEKI